MKRQSRKFAYVKWVSTGSLETSYCCRKCGGKFDEFHFKVAIDEVDEFLKLMGFEEQKQVQNIEAPDLLLKEHKVQGEAWNLSLFKVR